MGKRSKSTDESVAKKMKTETKKNMSPVFSDEASSDSSSGSSSDEDQVVHKRLDSPDFSSESDQISISEEEDEVHSKKKVVKKDSSSKSKSSKATTSKGESSKATTSKGKSSKSSKSKTEEDKKGNKKSKARSAIPPSLNPKCVIGSTKIKKPNFKKDIDVPDPSSKVKTDEHKYKVIYNGEVYYVKSLPHKHFQDEWDGICKMRKEGGVASDAPVDRVGCSKLYDHDEKDPRTIRFQHLVALILSSQAADEQVAKAMTNLKKYGLNIPNMCKIPIDDLDEMIGNLSFHQNKSKFIIETARHLRDHYESDVPKTKAEIMILPGCGVKVANLAMYTCWGKKTGVAIDTHLERILYRLRWSTSEKREKQMKDIESWMPKAMWFDLNEKLLGHGQTICSKQSPKCNVCLINKTCHFYAKEF